MVLNKTKSKSQQYKFLKPVCFLLLFINKANANDFESHVIESLPGYNGTLPFNFETGYVGVGEDNELQFFYYFAESERDPVRDPLIFWITGGPGCSGFSGLVYEIGPVAFDVEAFDGSLPSFVLNPYSWTKVASIIFIDSPVGTGFSYATSSESYPTSDTKTAEDNYNFLRKWMLNHSTFVKNRVYIAGDSYGGKIAPMIALAIAEGNEAGVEPRINLQGYIVGNSATDRNKDTNQRIPYAHRMGLISDEYYELAKSSCNGEYVNPDPNNYQCKYALQLCKQCTKLLNNAHILETKCTLVSPKPDNAEYGGLFPDDIPLDFLRLSKQYDEPRCRAHNYAISYVWADDESVREALYIRKGTIVNWTRCNKTLVFEKDVESIQYCHKLLSEKGYQVLAYSGDHDMLVPYMSTLRWIRDLNLSVDDAWRPWTVDGQVAGYTAKYANNQAFLTFATVKGAGHTAPEYEPNRCFAMLDRWLSMSPL